MSFSYVVFFSFVYNSFSLFFFYSNRYYQIYLMSPWGMNVKWYMKCFIYWSADLTSSELWCSQLWKQFKQLPIEANDQLPTSVASYKLSWIALIDDNVRWDTDEFTTAFLHSDWLSWYRTTYFLLNRNV